MNDFQETACSLLQKFCMLHGKQQQITFRKMASISFVNAWREKKKMKIRDVHTGMLYTNLLLKSCLTNLGSFNHNIVDLGSSGRRSFFLKCPPPSFNMQFCREIYEQQVSNWSDTLEQTYITYINAAELFGWQRG